MGVVMGQAVVAAPASWEATAYCKGERTAVGSRVERGIAASDPEVLPLGSIVRVTTGAAEWDGIYSVHDTGPGVQGKALDLYVWSCYDALEFGRRPVDVEIVRWGWRPNEVVGR